MKVLVVEVGITGVRLVPLIIPIARRELRSVVSGMSDGKTTSSLQYGSTGKFS